MIKYDWRSETRVDFFYPYGTKKKMKEKISAENRLEDLFERRVGFRRKLFNVPTNQLFPLFELPQLCLRGSQIVKVILRHPVPFQRSNSFQVENKTYEKSLVVKSYIQQKGYYFRTVPTIIR